MIKQKGCGPHAMPILERALPAMFESYTSLDFNVRVHCHAFTDFYNCILVKIIMLLKCEMMFLDIGGKKFS